MVRGWGQKVDAVFQLDCQEDKSREVIALVGSHVTCVVLGCDLGGLLMDWRKQ